MCAAQCGSMEAKTLSFVLDSAGSEHHQSSTRRLFTYVVGGQVGMKDAGYFSLNRPRLPLHGCVASTMCASANIPLADSDQLDSSKRNLLEYPYSSEGRFLQNSKLPCEWSDWIFLSWTLLEMTSCQIKFMTIVSVVTPSMDSCTTRVHSVGFALFRDCQFFWEGKTHRCMCLCRDCG